MTAWPRDPIAGSACWPSPLSPTPAVQPKPRRSTRAVGFPARAAAMRAPWAAHKSPHNHASDAGLAGCEAQADKLVVDIAVRRVPAKFGLDPVRDVQVLTPV